MENLAEDSFQIRKAITNEQELINFLETHNEYLIAKYIKHNIYLKLLANDELEISIKKNYDNEIVKKLVTKYQNLTGKKLSIKNVKQNSDNKTISEQEILQRQEVILEYQESEEFKKFKQLFPDIEIVSD
ncbi:MAG: hypothetical protein ISQ32_02265 [Rickettsiales bacterium]|nr:hypothetical protein [Rickettsiales bacterium]